MSNRTMSDQRQITVLIGEPIPPHHFAPAGESMDPVRVLVVPLKEFGAPAALDAMPPVLAEESQTVEILALFDSSLPADTLTRFPNLRWIHLFGAGANRALDLGLFESPVQITNARGVAARPMAEWVLLCMLALLRRLPDLVRQQERHTWNRHPAKELAGKTVGLIGLGAVGREVARLASALDMRVVAVRRRPSHGELPAGVAREYGPDALPLLLHQSDFVAVCVPLTGETRSMIGAREIATMKPTAFLINVSRGGIVDEAALAQALREGRLAGAALDVFEHEPLPADSPWWTMPNVLVSPHQAGWSERTWERTLELFAENLQRYCAGRPLLNRLGPGGY